MEYEQIVKEVKAFADGLAFKRYFQRMSYRIMPVEYYALHDLLITQEVSEYELNRRWALKAADILYIKNCNNRWEPVNEAIETYLTKIETHI